MISQQLDHYISSVCEEFDQLPEERKEKLQAIIDFVQKKKEANEIINLILICTHNSRRSHLSQVWTQVAARYYGFSTVFSYSGGTEATALFPSAKAALQKTGLQIQQLTEGGNPVYAIKYAENEPAIMAFSKRFDDAFNPQSDYAAVMTCNHADQNCPIVPHAQRISLPFEDPKAFDGTPQQEEKYDERCRDIARELLYVFSKVK